jgi:catechol 2,3-dioxygenase-like lactoylglutathione lyase family enzyme
MMAAMAGPTDNITWSHVAVCVSDLDRSLTFYTEGLGFSEAARWEFGAEWGPALEVPGDIKVTSVFLTHHDGRALELESWSEPGVEGQPSDRRNLLGFTHLSFRVDDPDAIALHLEAWGGQILDATRTEMADPSGSTTIVVFVADPDGLRIELVGQRAAA